MKDSAQIRGQGGTKVEGLHDDYALTIEPTWHPDAQGGRSCVGLRAELEISLHLPSDAEDPGAARQRLEEMLNQAVLVQAPGLRFQGHIRRLKWLQQVSGDGALGSASITLVVERVDRVQGQES
jgi:hypothetical protein